jgi:thiamine-phosphate pyrophosphorylase
VPESTKVSNEISNRLRATRYYGILDTGYVSHSDWIAKYDSLVQGGAGIIQIRAKRENPRQRESLLERIVEHRSKASSPQPLLIVNDDIELCTRYPDVGLHIGQDDTPPDQARARLGPDRVIGLSTHSVEQAKSAMALPEGAIDYFAVGPVFATQTKPDYTPVGLELIKWVASQSPRLPFFCIGGINRENASQVSAAGAQRIVTVSDALLADDTAAAVRDTIDTIGEKA